MKYMIWNNKGGVGKTFVTFLLATEYAVAHPEQDVVVVDLCPQANISEMLLGGNGAGEKKLLDYHQKKLTISAYINERVIKSMFSKLGTESEYFIPVRNANQSIEGNFYLLPGDADLDLCSNLINYFAAFPNDSTAWKKSRLLLRELIESFQAAQKLKNRETVFFIDCNPSFAPYTELAVVAADRIIVPCTGDSGSVRGIHNLFRYIYGKNIDAPKNIETASDLDFSTRSRSFNLTLPKLHFFVQNKSRSLDQKATKAFTANIDKIAEIASNAKNLFPDLFSNQTDIVQNIKDGNTLSSIINHNGLPLSKVQATKYTIYETVTQADQGQIERLLKDVQHCVGLI